MLRLIKACLLVFFISADTAVAQQQSLCAQGLEAYQRTVYSYAQQQICVACHNGGHPEAPAWLDAHIEISYQRIKSYIDFVDPEQSTLVVRAGNGHCGTGCTNEGIQKGFIEQINLWWQGGESLCDTYVRTKDYSVPDHVNGMSFVEMSWPLSDLNEAVGRAKLVVDIKATYSATSASEVTGYIIKNPRIVSDFNAKTLHVTGLRLYVDQKMNWWANQYEDVLATVEPGQNKTLSQTAMIIEAHKDQKLSVGFKYLEVE